MRKFYSKGLTMVEIIVTLGILGILILPLMNIFILCGKILNINHKEYETSQIAQYYMEEIKAMEEIDRTIYSYKDEKGIYQRIVIQDDLNYGAEIQIIPDDNGLLYRIEINVLDNGQVVNNLRGSVIFD